MPLKPGDRLGPYGIVEVLGEGGMGTVYRAHDARLARDVAIKIVRIDFASDPDRISRFEREARLLASLNHPHVATIHGLEEAAGTRFLVMELVEGVSLNERLRDGPIAVREALGLGLQMVGAIAAAHERNIIHRDLKPANIKITPTGNVKLLDFGLAKALSIDSASAMAQSPTLPAGGTGAGVVLGTAAYMSPEQARGKEVDRRTDIWAFGCVLFDMLTGKAAFAGDTFSDTLAAILTREPDWGLLPPDVPPPVARLLRRCLEKDANRRLRDVADARFELEDALTAPGDSGRAGLPTVTAASPRAVAHQRRRVTTIAAVALLAGALLGAIGWSLFSNTPEARPPQTVRIAVPLPEDQRLAGLDFQMVAISQTDSHIAYVASQRGRQQLFLRPLASFDAIPLEGTDGALNPFFSPDGKWIAFFSAGKLKKVPIDGGASRDIADADIGFGGVWAPDGTIVFAPSNASGLARVSADGGAVQPVTTLDTARGEFSHRWPTLLPDGKTVLFAIGTLGSWDDADIAAQRLDGGTRRILVQGGTYPRFLSTGQLVYAQGGSLHAVDLDPRTYEVRGPSRPVLSGVLQSVDGAAEFVASPLGGIAYVPGASGENRTLVWVNRAGVMEPLAAPPHAYTSPRLSPDGRTLAVGIAGTPEQIWTYAIPESRLAQLTFEGGSSPTWGSDGTRIFFSAARGGPPSLFAKAAEGGAEQRLTRSDRANIPQSISPTGTLLYVELDPDSGRDISILMPDGTTRKVVATAANESAPAFSPDGQWMAYVSDETGRPEVFVAPLSDPQRHVQVSTAGGSEPVWRHDGTELFFRAGNRMMAASVRTRPTFSATSPRQLFDGTFETGTGGSPAYDVSHDGMRFLMVKPAATDREGRELRVVLGWTNELKR